jgi:short-subunit dehydrogenase
VQGTWHAVQLANALRVGCFHHVSSIAVAGRYPGVFREDMFAEATGLDEPYSRTKHASEALVRNECRVPWRVYRPGIVVGHSQTGQMDKVDGPYYLFGLLQRAAAALPGRLPLVGVDSGAVVNLVPVDFVAAAMDHIAHQRGLDGRAFHLVDPHPESVIDTINLFATIAGAPRIAARIGGSLGSRVAGVLGGPLGVVPLTVAGAAANSWFGIPASVVRLVDSPTRFDCRETAAALAGTGIEVPPLESYAHLLWDWWENELDADLRFSPALARAVGGRRVLVTGASAGIGRAAALKLGAAGARVLLVARSRDRLEHVRSVIEHAGGEAHVYPVDLTDIDACGALADRVIGEHGGVDVLVNNAGHSIRRSLDIEVERFHDYQRTMQINYFAALKLTLAFLPGMRARHDGQIVNVSSMGVQMGGARFSAYVASKAALDAFARSAAAELMGEGVAVTTIYMPLVRTAMSKPTRAYDLVPELTSAQAAGWICQAVIDRPRRIAMRGAVLAEALHVAAPGLFDAIENGLFRATQPGSTASSIPDTAVGVAENVARQVPGWVRRLPAVPRTPALPGRSR